MWYEIFGNKMFSIYQSIYDNPFQISSSMEWYHTLIWCNIAQETCWWCWEKTLFRHLTRFAVQKLSNNSLNYINLTLIAQTFYVSFDELVLFVEDSALKHLPIGAEAIKLHCVQVCNVTMAMVSQTI